uniref:Uncharacterized protein n=1 Tax=Cucumis melo TaxID=3656 RepID=A0A9I9EEP3_CUCME
MTSGIGLTSPNVPCMASRGVEQLFYYILLADVVNIDVRNDHTCPNAFRRDVVEIQELNIHLTSSDVFNHDVGITRLGRHMFVGIGDESLCSDESRPKLGTQALPPSQKWLLINVRLRFGFSVRVLQISVVLLPLCRMEFSFKKN